MAITETTTTIETLVVAPIVTAYSSSGFPLPSVNVTSLAPPYPVNVTSTSSSSTTTPSVTPTTSTATMSTPVAPPAPFVPDGCPEINGTTLTTTDGSVYLVLCNTDFIGRDSIGLRYPDLQSCVEECSIANAGFSANRCLGVSYRPQLASNCYLKAHVDNPTTNTTYEVVSAVLISSLNSTYTTNSTATTNTSSTVPYSTFNTTSYSLGPTVTTSFNITSLASITASPSFNVTTAPVTTYYPSLSMDNNRSEWTSVCSNCPSVSTSTLYSTSTVYVTIAAPTI